MTDATTKSKRTFWLMLAAVVFFSTVPSLVLIDKAKEYYRFLSGWTPGTLKPKPGSLPPHSAGSANGALAEIHFVEFGLDAPGAKDVRLTAGFTGWDKNPLAMEAAAGSSWKIVVPLPAGTYHYAFKVDGVLMPDPANPGKGVRGGREVSVREVP